MSSDYADRKLQEAVAQAGAAPNATRRLVMEWIERDDALLRALVRPFLAGIIGHAVDRAIRAAPKRQPAQPRALSPTALDGLVQRLTENFGPQPDGASASGNRTSARHAEAIRTMVRAGAARRLA